MNRIKLQTKMAAARIILIAGLVCACCVCSGICGRNEQGFYTVNGPCGLSFPRDHGPHPGYRTEWWYYTGNLRSGAGDAYGFQFTIFRNQIAPNAARRDWPEPASRWRTGQMYLGHAALTDVSGGRHYFEEKMFRGALGMADAVQADGRTRVFVGDWSASIVEGGHSIRADADEFALSLTLDPLKKIVRHGQDGYSRKGQAPERASCYYSYTRLAANGAVSIGNRKIPVKGLGWMDHEFSTAVLEPGTVGWDWFSIQLSDQTELMAFLLRRDDGGIADASSGTLVAASGMKRDLTRNDFQIAVKDTWKSSYSGAEYPVAWRLTIPSEDFTLTIRAKIPDQEMRTRKGAGVTYWEGCVSADGIRSGKPVSGDGYVELTGYASPFDAPM